MTTANSKGVRQRNLSFLDNPVDPSLSKCLFREDDPLLRFYEHKYKFPLKDIRPFAQHTATLDADPRFNEAVFQQELDKVTREEERVKSELAKRYRVIAKNGF